MDILEALLNTRTPGADFIGTGKALREYLEDVLEIAKMYESKDPLAVHVIHSELTASHMKIEIASYGALRDSKDWKGTNNG